MPPNERSCPRQEGSSSEAIDGHRTTFTTPSGLMIFAEIDAREIGRYLELDPHPRSQAEARRAFLLASVIRQVRGQVFA